jgi:hypothetical protein
MVFIPEAGSDYTYGLRFDQYNPTAGRGDYFPWTSLSVSIIYLHAKLSITND